MLHARYGSLTNEDWHWSLSGTWSFWWETPSRLDDLPQRPFQFASIVDPVELSSAASSGPVAMTARGWIVEASHRTQGCRCPFPHSTVIVLLEMPFVSSRCTAAQGTRTKSTAEVPQVVNLRFHGQKAGKHCLSLSHAPRYRAIQTWSGDLREPLHMQLPRQDRTGSLAKEPCLEAALRQVKSSDRAISPRTSGATALLPYSCCVRDSYVAPEDSEDISSEGQRSCTVPDSRWDSEAVQRAWAHVCRIRIQIRSWSSTCWLVIVLELEVDLNSLVSSLHSIETQTVSWQGQPICIEACEIPCHRPSFDYSSNRRRPRPSNQRSWREVGTDTQKTKAATLAPTPGLS